jgi:hypothetical protein
MVPGCCLTAFEIRNLSVAGSRVVFQNIGLLHEIPNTGTKFLAFWKYWKISQIRLKLTDNLLDWIQIFHHGNWILKWIPNNLYKLAKTQNLKIMNWFSKCQIFFQLEPLTIVLLYFWHFSHYLAKQEETLRTYFSSVPVFSTLFNTNTF